MTRDQVRRTGRTPGNTGLLLPCCVLEFNKTQVHRSQEIQSNQYITDDMALPSRLLAGVLLILAAALVCSSAERRRTGHGQDRDASAPQLPRPPRFGVQDHRPESPVPPLRPLGLRKPVAAPPPPRPGTPRASIRPYHPSPPPPPPPCSKL